MRSHLKVKACSMSAEMTFIRRQELKWKKRAKYAREKSKQLSVDYSMDNFWSLRHHRDALKGEVRHAHLAYGFMLGVPYAVMENICYGPIKGSGSYEPIWKSIENMVERFSKDEPNPQAIMQKFSEWLADAKLWYEGNPERIEEAEKVKALVLRQPKHKWSPEEIETRKSKI